MEMFASSLQNEEEKEEYKKLTIIHEINDDCTHMTTTTATAIESSCKRNICYGFFL